MEHLTSPLSFKRQPVHSQMSLPRDIFLHLITILDTNHHRGTLATMLRTSQDMYALLAPMVYATVGLSKRVEEGLFKGIWGSLDEGKAKEDAEVRLEDVVMGMSRHTGGMLGKMLRRIGKAKQIMSSPERFSRIHDFIIPPHPNFRKDHLLTHTTTLCLDSLPSKEMIYRLYDLSLVKPAPLFPNLQHLIISGEVAWQWETNPTYQRGKEAFLIAFDRFKSVNKICIHHSRLTVGRDQYLNTYPVYQTGMNTEILGPYPQRTPAKEIRMDLSWIPPVESLCIHGIVSQRIKIPKQAKKVRLEFEPCLCVQRIGVGVFSCLDHLEVEQRREQVLEILRDGFGEGMRGNLEVEVEGVDMVGETGLVRSRSGGTTITDSVLPDLTVGMEQAGIPLDQVTFVERRSARRDCQWRS